MALTTVNLTARAATQTGAPMAGVVVSARLDRTDRDPDDGWVTPETVSATTDATGEAVLVLWPNSRGTEGSVYQVTLTDADGVLLMRGIAALQEADANLADVATEWATTPAAWPAVDNGRRARVVADILDMLHQTAENTAYVARVERWLDLLLRDLANYSFWFWRRAAGSTLMRGQDVVDLSGDIQRVDTLYVDGRELTRVPLTALLGMRSKHGGFGDVTCCALEAGFRVHLYPAPKTDVALSVVYRRPVDLALLPDEYEELAMAGVIGRYARHFDRGALATDPGVFLDRYQELLVRAMSGDADMQVSIDAQPWLHRLPHGSGQATPTASAGDVQPARYSAPASMTGVGYASVECGVYPITVY